MSIWGSNWKKQNTTGNWRGSLFHCQLFLNSPVHTCLLAMDQFGRKKVYYNKNSVIGRLLGSCFPPLLDLMGGLCLTGQFPKVQYHYYLAVFDVLSWERKPAITCLLVQRTDFFHPCCSLSSRGRRTTDAPITNSWYPLEIMAMATIEGFFQVTSMEINSNIY